MCTKYFSTLVSVTSIRTFYSTSISWYSFLRWGNWGTEDRAGATPRLPDSNPELLILELHCFSTSPSAIKWHWNCLWYMYSFPRVAITNCHKLEMYSLTVQDSRSSKSKCLQGWFVQETLMENSSPYLSPNFWWQPAISSISWLSCITPIFASIFTSPSPSCDSASSFLPLIKTSVIGFRVHTIQDDLIMESLPQ